MQINPFEGFGNSEKSFANSEENSLFFFFLYLYISGDIFRTSWIYSTAFFPLKNFFNVGDISRCGFSFHFFSIFPKKFQKYFFQKIYEEKKVFIKFFKESWWGILFFGFAFKGNGFSCSYLIFTLFLLFIVLDVSLSGKIEIRIFIPYKFILIDKKINKKGRFANWFDIFLDLNF